ncbi:MAG: hypothetical protein NZ742_01385 [Acidobacteria bacterium]|nr:hypothetical protein [Acidobacteriota bacterium]MDW7983339.1 hypothetical protein [Acidobacteriota bacterium]
MGLTVLKVGGSLGERGGLKPLCRTLGQWGRRWPLVIVPGGGAFAEMVRQHYAHWLLREATAHWMAILAVDQYGYLLSDLIPNAVPVFALRDARRLAGTGRIPVLLPGHLLRRFDPLPHTWAVTSDSIAAWVALRLNARRLVLLKDVDGLFDGDPAQDPTASMFEELTVADLAERHPTGRIGGVDGYLSCILAQARFETWVISGRAPERLIRLFETGRTQGTRIRPVASGPLQGSLPRR